MRKVPELKFVPSTGQYRVRFNRDGKRKLLSFGTNKENAELAYAAWKLEWVQATVAGSVRQVNNTTGWHAAAGVSADITDELTLDELGKRYVKHCQRVHTKNEAKNKRLCVEHVLKHVGDVYWSEFGTAAYTDLQDALVAEGRTLQRINKVCGEVRAWMKWCFVKQLITTKLHQDFRDVGPVRSTWAGVVESPGVIAVDWDDVEPVLPFMSPVVAAMVTVQFWSGMRPGEVCAMKYGELNTSDPEVWFYRPANHKNSHRIKNKTKDSKHVLIKGIGKIAQDAMRPFVERCDDPGDFVFRPIDAMEWRAQQMEKTGRHEDRKCKVYPSELVARKRRKETRQTFWEETCNPSYITNSYGKAVAYAFDKADREGVDLERWSPGQLRHGIAQKLRDVGNMQGATALLGHKNSQMTVNYAALTEEELRRVVGNLDELNAA